MKRIVICADGTWNLRDQLDAQTGKRRPSNVTKVARGVRPRARDGVDQVVYYHDGIGTGGLVDRLTGGAFGAGMEGHVRNLYRFLVYNYEPNDELYFFGFSRGAFTVRTLAGFMHRTGLVEKDDDYWVPELYACYERSQGDGTREWAAAHRHIQGKRPCPPIRFIGVWDTVGSLGAPGILGQLFNRSKYAYHDVGLNPSIQAAFHALAIDEQRVPFKPTLWERPADWHGTLEQVWFVGAHSNVGGGSSPDGLANEALHWMVEQSEACGLEFDDAYLAHFRACFDSTLHDSMSLQFRLFGRHLRPLGRQRRDGERLHQSVVDRRGHLNEYRPQNLERWLAGDTVGKYVQTWRCERGSPCGRTSVGIRSAISAGAGEGR